MIPQSGVKRHPIDYISGDTLHVTCDASLPHICIPNDAIHAGDALLAHLHRGGQWAHYWTNAPKKSHWFPVGNRPPIPASWAGRNVYFSVHPCGQIPTENSRGESATSVAVRVQNDHVAAANCFFAEYDAKDWRGGKAAILAHLNTFPQDRGWPYPSVIVDSGGGFHCYWLLESPVTVTNDNRDDLRRVQAAWVHLVGGDVASKDFSRVLRVPGTLNVKPEYGPNFPTVAIVEVDWRRLYSLADFEKLTEHLQTDPIPTLTPAQPVHSNGTGAPHAGYTFTDNLTSAAANLKRLRPGRADDYHQWVSVGMALAGLGDAGLQLWDDWSRQSGKYQAGECAKKWKGFTPGDGLGLGSLAHWADEDDPTSRHRTTGPNDSDAPVETDDATALFLDIHRADAHIAQTHGKGGGPGHLAGVPVAQAEPAKRKWTAAEILRTEFPDPKWAVPGLLPVGLCILAGRPKLGKSWFSLQTAVAVGTGGKLLGRDVERGKVLYLALEDSPRRIQDRLRKQRADGRIDVDFQFEWQPLTGQGTADLFQAVDSGGYSLVIVDTLSRALGRADQNDLAAMGVAVGSLQRLAIDRGICLLLIDHHRKSASTGEGDPIDDLMGSTGKSAPLDVGLGLFRKRSDRNATLKITGRDVEEMELAVNFDRDLFCWQFLGNAGEVVNGDKMDELLKALRTLGKPTHRELMDATGQDRGNSFRRLQELIQKGKVRRIEGAPIRFAIAGD